MKVVASGMVTALGLTAPSTCAAVRARVSPFAQVPFHDDALENVIGARVPGIAEPLPGRLSALLAPAVAECLQDFPSRHAVAEPTLLVAGPGPERDEVSDASIASLVSDVQDRLGRKFGAASRTVRRGVSGFFELLAEAPAVMKGRTGGCIVAAVDSLFEQANLIRLDRANRLKTVLNSDGVIPGEAAAAVWLAPADDPRPDQMVIKGLGFGNEQSAGDSEKPRLATGLADAMRAACVMAGMGIHEIVFRVGGMTGEREGFMEASIAEARLMRVRRDQPELWVPAEKLGDAGAALPACMAVLVAFGFAKHYAPGDSALLFASCSAGPARAASVVVASKEEKSSGR